LEIFKSIEGYKTRREGKEKKEVLRGTQEPAVTDKAILNIGGE